MVYRGKLTAIDAAPLGGGPPLNVAVGVASGIVVQAVQRRKKIILVNDSINVIYLARADEARVNAGIRLNANGGSYEDVPDTLGRMYDGPWAAISTGAASNLCISQDS